MPQLLGKEPVKVLTAAGCDVAYLDIESSWGHDAFLVEAMTRLLGSFLDRMATDT